MYKSDLLNKTTAKVSIGKCHSMDRKKVPYITSKSRSSISGKLSIKSIQLVIKHYIDVLNSETWLTFMKAILCKYRTLLDLFRHLLAYSMSDAYLSTIPCFLRLVYKQDNYFSHMC